MGTRNVGYKCIVAINVLLLLWTYSQSTLPIYLHLLVFITQSTVLCYIIYITEFPHVLFAVYISLCSIDCFQWILKFRKGNVPTFVTTQCLMGKWWIEQLEEWPPSKWIRYVEGLKKSLRQKSYNAPDIRIHYLQAEILRVVARVKALRYKPAGHGFDPQWCHLNFSLT